MVRFIGPSPGTSSVSLAKPDWGVHFFIVHSMTCVVFSAGASHSDRISPTVNGPTCVPGRCDAERGNCIVSIQLGGMLSFATCGAGLLWVLINHQKQALHDRIADTVVIDDGADNGRNWTR
jgi:hypothetical protein